MLSWKKRVVKPNIDLIWIDVLFIQCILLIYENKLLTIPFLKAFLVYSILSYLPKTFAQYKNHSNIVYSNISLYKREKATLSVSVMLMQGG